MTGSVKRQSALGPLHPEYGHTTTLPSYWSFVYWLWIMQTKLLQYIEPQVYTFPPCKVWNHPARPKTSFKFKAKDPRFLLYLKFGLQCSSTYLRPCKACCRSNLWSSSLVSGSLTTNSLLITGCRSLLSLALTQVQLVKVVLCRVSMRV